MITEIKRYANFTANVTFTEFCKILYPEVMDEDYLERKFVQMRTDPTFVLSLDKVLCERLDRYLSE
jgi:hypothetical protein